MKRLIAIFLNVIVISLLFSANPAYSLCTGGSSGAVTCTCDAELPTCSTNQTIKYDGTNWVCSGSTGSSSGGPPARVFSMEYKGLTAGHAGNLGLSFYDGRCNALYPGSWVLRSSNFEQIETLPAVNARLHIDAATCYDLAIGTGRSCTIEPTLPRFSFNGGHYAYNWNCENWVTTSPSSTTTLHFVKTSSAATPIRYNNQTGGSGLEGDSTTTGRISYDPGSSTCSDSIPFICVGYKAGYGP